MISGQHDPNRGHYLTSEFRTFWRGLVLNTRSNNGNLLEKSQLDTDPVLTLTRSLTLFNLCEIPYSLPYNLHLITYWRRSWWPSFSRRHFQIRFYNGNYFILLESWLTFVPRGRISQHWRFWHRAADKPFSEQMLAQFTNVFLRYIKPKWINWTHRLMPHSKRKYQRF